MRQATIHSVEDRRRIGNGAWIALLALMLFPASSSSSEIEIPARPEELRFDPLEYQPPEPSDYRVELEAGPVAYVIPDRTLPLIDVAVFVRTGGYVVPKGKAGLGGLTGYLIARGGTEKRTAEELEERLDFLAAELGSGIGETHGTVNLNLLSKDVEEGFAILREVLTVPRFQEDKIDLRKSQLLQAMRQRNDDPATIEERERRFLSYGEEFWMNQLPTQASVDGISREDLRAFHRRWFHPANFVVAVSGDFEHDDMVKRLETLFSDWPFEGEKPPPVPDDAVFASPGIYMVEKDANQGRVSILLPGVKRDNPDYYAIIVMNDILGGSGFTSRIMSRVRSDEGLAYAAYSHFQGGTYFPSPFMAGFQSKSPTVAYAASIVLEEMKRIAGEPVTQDELKTSKQSIIESFPRTFATKGQTAIIFAQDELTGRFQKDPQYWAAYRDRIAAVDASDVQRVAAKYLTPEKLVILVVGQKDDILEGHPDHAVKLESLGARIVDLPLRDPMTLRPISE